MPERDNAADRKEGEYWERRFCEHAATRDRMFTGNQIGRKTSAHAIYGKPDDWSWLTLPDIVIWSSPGEHHEIKHKNPTRNGRFGLEDYRFDALVRFANEIPQTQGVYYTIHNWELAGGKAVRESYMDHWMTINIRDLELLIQSRDSRKAYSQAGETYYNGEMVRQIRGRDVLIWYWPSSAWYPLATLWSQRLTTAI